MGCNESLTATSGGRLALTDAEVFGVPRVVQAKFVAEGALSPPTVLEHLSRPQAAYLTLAAILCTLARIVSA